MGEITAKMIEENGRNGDEPEAVYLRDPSSGGGHARQSSDQPANHRLDLTVMTRRAEPRKRPGLAAASTGRLRGSARRSKGKDVGPSPPRYRSTGGNRSEAPPGVLRKLRPCAPRGTTSIAGRKCRGNSA